MRVVKKTEGTLIYTKNGAVVFNVGDDYATTLHEVVEGWISSPHFFGKKVRITVEAEE